MVNMEETMKLSLICLLLLFSFSIFAGQKEDLVSAIVKQCKLSEADAEKLLTPGRTGNIVQFSICAKSPQDISDTCKVFCSKDNAAIGGK